MSVLLNRFHHYETKVNLKGGEMYYADKPALVWTVLGSCLGIIFYNNRLKVGAIAHAQLPEQNLGSTPCSISCPVKCEQESPNPRIFKYVSCSFHNMIKKFYRLGFNRDEIDVKIFGGANVIQYNSNCDTVGQQNIEKALSLVKEYNLSLVKKDLGGNIGRTIYFCSDTGEVFLRRHENASHVIKQQERQEIINEELVFLKNGKRPRYKPDMR